MQITHNPFNPGAGTPPRILSGPITPSFPHPMTSAHLPTISHAAFLKRIARQEGGIYAAWNGEKWRIEVIDQGTLKCLTRSGTRLAATFAHLNDVTNYLLALGIPEFSVVLDDGAAEPAEYADWLRDATAEGLRAVNDPTTVWISHEASDTSAERLISELLSHGDGRHDGR